jgi:predicted nucleic acid-binding protein
MAVFIDTGILVAVRNRSDNMHAAAARLMEAALKGRYGRMCTSDFVLDEAITTTLARTHRHDLAAITGRFVIDSPRIELLSVGRDHFDMAWKKFLSLSKRPMSFTDCTTMALMEAHGIEKVMSFDAEFDDFVERIH